MTTPTAANESSASSSTPQDTHAPDTTSSHNTASNPNNHKKHKSKHRRKKTTSSHKSPDTHTEQQTTSTTPPLSSQPSVSTANPSALPPTRTTRAGLYAMAVMICVIATVQLVRLHHPAPKATGASPPPAHTSHTSDGTMTLALAPLVNDINDKLTKVLEKTTKTPNTSTNMTLVDVKAMHARLEEMMATQVQHTHALAAMQETVNHAENTMKTRLTQLTHSVDAIKQVLEPVHYLGKNALPFTVTSLDVIAGRPVVSVQYHHTTVPLEPGFHLAGWTLQSANYHEQTAIFKSKGTLLKNGKTHEQYARIALDNTHSNNTTSSPSSHHASKGGKKS